MRFRLLTLSMCVLFAGTAAAACTFGFLSEVMTPAGSNTGDLATGDFNHDGLDDIAVVNRQSSNIAILLGSQGGTFAAPSFVSTGGSNQDDILAAYINGDNHLDLVAMGGSIPYPGYPDFTGTHVQVLLGDGLGNFTLGDSELVGTNPLDLVAGDFDNDNDVDIAVSQTVNYGFNLLLNNGSGVLTQKSINTMPETGYPTGIAAGDFDGDGKLDVVMGGGSTRKAWVFFGIGDGTFVSPATPIVTTANTDHGAGPVAAGDFNSDGFDDVAVSNFTNASYYPGILTPHVVVALSNGAGRTFTSAVAQGESDNPQDILVHDMDGDGTLDIVVGNGPSIRIFFGEGDGSFNPETHGNGGIGIGILDVDNDGGPDLAASHFSSNVGILQNVCGQVNLELISSANPASHGNSFTITTSLTSNPAATGTLTLSRTGGGTLGSTNLNAATSVSASQTLPIGTYEYVATYTGDSRFSAATRTLIQTVQTAPFGPPPGLVATSTGGNVQLTWYATSGTARYEIWRQGSLGSFQVGETTDAFFTDDAPPSSAFVYRVRAISPTNIASDYSSDFTITHAFTDENIIAGATLVKGAHITEVRNAANALRSLAGLPVATWTSSSVVLAAQFNEVRTAINQARTALGFSAGVFTDALTLGVSVKGIHMMELRAAMR